MNVLFLSGGGVGYVLAWQMCLEGHDVRFYTKNKADRKIGDGFVPKVTKWEDSLEWADYVVSDDCGWGKINEKIRAMGVPVIGGTILTDALEEDRGVGQKMFQALGMDVLPSMEFKKIEEAISYIEKTPSKYVVKVSGKSQADKSLTYVGQMDDGSDVKPVLEHMASKSGIKIDSVQLQEKADGVEVAIGGFFNGKEFINPVGVNFEHKKLFPSRTEQAGTGPATGEMGTVNCWKDKGFSLYQETLGKFVPVLKKEGYCGYFDINCIVHSYNGIPPEKDFHIHPLEVTCRFGWPTLPLQIETMKINDLGDLFYRMACSDCENFSVSHQYSTAVVIGCPPLPYKHQEIADDYSSGMPILFRNQELIDGIYPGDCYDEEGQWCCAGDLGYPVVCCSGGDSVEESKMRAYDRVRNVIIPNSMVRDDIGDFVPMNIMLIKSLLEFSPEEVV